MNCDYRKGDYGGKIVTDEVAVNHREQVMEYTDDKFVKIHQSSTRWSL